MNENFKTKLKALEPKKMSPISLKKVFTPFTFNPKESSDKKSSETAQKVIKGVNIAWAAIVALIVFDVILKYGDLGFKKIIGLTLLVLMAFAFCGVLIQAIGPIVPKKKGRKKSKEIGKHPFRSRRKLREFGKIMREKADSGTVMDTNYQRALIEVLFTTGCLKKGLVSKEILAEWLAEYCYENNYSDSCYAVKSITKAERYVDYLEDVKSLFGPLMRG